MNFPQITEMDNQGGNLTFDYIPIPSVLFIPRPVSGKVLSPILLNVPAVWFLGYSTKDTLSFETEPVTNEQGTYYQHAVKGFYPKPSPELISHFDNMKNQKFIVRITDSNNRIRIVGGINQPCTFSYSEITGSRAQDLPGVNFEFNNANYHPCFFYGDGS
jgi:hypothetical protein